MLRCTRCQMWTGVKNLHKFANVPCAGVEPKCEDSGTISNEARMSGSIRLTCKADDLINCFDEQDNPAITTISSNCAPESSASACTVDKKEASCISLEGREELNLGGSSPTSARSPRQRAGVDASPEDDSLVIDWGSNPPDSPWNEAGIESPQDDLRPISEILPPSPISQGTVPEPDNQQEENQPRPFISRT